LSILLAFACQRGEHDPVFSVRTRKARLKGDWKVVSYHAESNGLVTSYEGGNITYTQGDTFELTVPFTWTATFDGEGAYHFTKTESYPADPDNGVAQAYTVTNEEMGAWEFTGGNNTPAKSQLLLLAEQIKSTRSDQGSNIGVVTIDHPHEGIVYDIDKLTYTDVVLLYEEVTSHAFGQVVDKAEIRLKRQK